VALQVLAELKAVFKADAGLELNVSKTSVLPSKVDMAQTIMQATPNIAHLRTNVLLDSFCPEGFIGIGVPLGTDAFVRSFVAKTCRDIIDDVEKLDAIQDGFIHFQLFRMALSTSSDFAKPPGFNILIRILCLIIVVFCNSSM
jgi:hypothetical protein